jgi:hypothetical protein
MHPTSFSVSSAHRDHIELLATHKISGYYIKGIPELVEKFLVTLKLLFCARKQNQNRHRQQNLNSKKNQLSKSTKNKEKENDRISE